MRRTCIDCALCSVYYPSFREVCDLTGKEVQDADTETCGDFTESEDAKNDPVSQ